MNPFLVIAVALVASVTLERCFPRTKLMYKEGWNTRAIIFNTIQMLVVILGAHTWEVWLQGPSLFKLPWSPFYNGLFAYLINTWIFYWFHLIRHDNPFLWLLLHAQHHSPERLEAITSFYKHPLEVLCNSLIIAVLTCPILGLDAQTNAWLTVFAALSEFFYHINISTPYWVGYFIQRPEMHLFHHQQDKRITYNYGDLSIWDILGATFFNPTAEQVAAVKTGFSQDRERQLGDILLAQNVLTERPVKMWPKDFGRCMLITMLFLLGCLSVIGVVFNSPAIRAVGFMSVASPLPYVFSAFQGVETFSTSYTMDVYFKNGTMTQLTLDHKLYARLGGSYQRRNVIGAVFSHGFLFVEPNMLEIRGQILNKGLCEGRWSKEFGIDEPIQKVVINVKSKTRGNEGKLWKMLVQC